MSVLDDPSAATTSELFDELIFQIASAATPEQRKYTTDLFRYFVRQVEFEAYRRGQQSLAIPQLPAPSEVIDMQAEPHEAPAIQPSDDASFGLIPPVRWQD